jgi:aminopeptidase N
VPSLTHAEAVERARLLTITAYDVRLDLTSATADDETGETFASRAVVRFASAEPGATSFADLKARRVRSITLNGAPLDPSTVTDGRLPLPGLAASNELVVEATMAYSRDGEGLHRDRGSRRRAPLRLSGTSSSTPRPASSPASTSPTSRPRTRARPRAEDWVVVGNGAGPRPTAARVARWRDQAALDLLRHVCAGPYVSASGRARRHPAGDLRAGLAPGPSSPRRRPRSSTSPRRSFDYYHAIFRDPVPVRRLRPGLRARVQRGAMENPGCVVLRDTYLFRGAASRRERLGRANTVCTRWRTCGSATW